MSDHNSHPFGKAEMPSAQSGQETRFFEHEHRDGTISGEVLDALSEVGDHSEDRTNAELQPMDAHATTPERVAVAVNQARASSEVTVSRAVNEDSEVDVAALLDELATRLNIDADVLIRTGHADLSKSLSELRVELLRYINRI